MRADAITCGRCDTRAMRWSCTPASTATGIAPTEDTMPCMRRSSSGRVSPVGVRNQVAPANRSARAFATPDRSPPATGCPPQKRARSAGVRAASTMLLADPTSVTTASSSAARRATRTTSGMSPTGAHTTTTRAPATASATSLQARVMAPRVRASSTAPSAGSMPRMSPTPASRRARPSDPPISPTPMRATGPPSPAAAT